jgi:hypothetical protein
MKTEMADKMNEAAGLYQSALEMMKEKADHPIAAQFEKSTNELDALMMTAVAAPMKSSVSCSTPL